MSSNQLHGLDNLVQMVLVVGDQELNLLTQRGRPQCGVVCRALLHSVH